MAVPKLIVPAGSFRPSMAIRQDTLLGSMLFTKRETFIEKVCNIKK
jgi:hypothetical protein